MKSYKICPSCNLQNSPDEIVCFNCMADISNVPVTEEYVVEEVKKTVDPGKKDLYIDDKTTIEIPKIILKGENFFIEIFSGDIVGRHEKGKEYLKEYKTVSRKHARFFKQAGIWYVEDLNSTNGVYINGKRINDKGVIKKGDRISLSLSLELTVDELN